MSYALCHMKLLLYDRGLDTRLTTWQIILLIEWSAHILYLISDWWESDVLYHKVYIIEQVILLNRKSHAQNISQT